MIGMASERNGARGRGAAWAAFVAAAIAAGCGAPPPAPRPSPPRPPPRSDVELPPGPDPAEACGDTAAGFDDWVAAFGERAMAQGISEDVARRALGRVAYDPGVIELDRAQAGTRPTFEEYVKKRVTPARLRRGKVMLERHAELFGKITARFGVPKELLAAIWGLETDFGDNQGSTPAVRALATLAWDCRRAPRFRAELSSALRLAQRGDVPVERMIGAWAGELGQTQFLPSSWEKFGIDFDGDGRVDLVGSSADALGSTANYLAGYGWRAGEPYGEGSANFAVLSEWNKSETYRKTIVLYASKLKAK